MVTTSGRVRKRAIFTAPFCSVFRIGRACKNKQALAANRFSNGNLSSKNNRQ
jgi:hypothetical protein